MRIRLLNRRVVVLTNRSINGVLTDFFHFILAGLSLFLIFNYLMLLITLA